MIGLKYGVIVCKDTENIGDDIQSYAAACLLPEVNYYIEREHMDVFRPKEEEPVNVIINGWLMNNKLGWPISACINPLYLSMHFLINDNLHVEDDFLKGLGGEDMKAHAPVGARDFGTQRLLEQNGIPSYFSGCLTLTLPRKFQKEVSEPYICLTDISDEAVNYVREQYPNQNIRIIEHVPRNLPPMVDQTADWNIRFQKVESLLEIYQNASAVVTTRLHCAMPCLALGTPVLLLKDDGLFDASRMDGLSELVYSATTSDFVSGKVDFNLENPPENPNQYVQIRNTLIQTAEDFLKGNAACTPELKARFCTYDSQWEARALWKNEILLGLEKKHIVYWHQTHDAFEEMEAGRQWLEQQVKKIEAEKQWLEQQYNQLVQENRNLRNWCAEQESVKTCLDAQIAMLESELQSMPRIVRKLAKKIGRR